MEQMYLLSSIELAFERGGKELQHSKGQDLENADHLSVMSSTVTFLVPCSVKHNSLTWGLDSWRLASMKTWTFIQSLFFFPLTLAKSSPEAMALTLSQN